MKSHLLNAAEKLAMSSNITPQDALILVSQLADFVNAGVSAESLADHIREHPAYDNIPHDCEPVALLWKTCKEPPRVDP